MGVGEAHGFHRAVAQGLRAAFGHDFNGQAAVEIGGGFFPLLEVTLFTVKQGMNEGVVLGAVEGAVDVILAGAAGPDLVVTGLKPGHVHVDRLAVNDGGDGVEKGEVFFARQRTYGSGEGRRGEGSGGDDDIVPVLRWQACNFAAFNCDQWVGFDAAGDFAGEAFTVHSESTACGHLMVLGDIHDEGSHHAHFFMQQAHGILFMIVAAERVGADEFCKVVGLVGVGCDVGAHFVQDDGDACICSGPGGFAAGHAAADDVDWLVHAGLVPVALATVNLLGQRNAWRLNHAANLWDRKRLFG